MIAAVVVSAFTLFVGGVVGLAVGCVLSAHALHERDEQIAVLIGQLDKRDEALKAATGKDPEHL